MVLDHSRYEGVYQNYYETSILTSNAAKKKINDLNATFCVFVTAVVILGLGTMFLLSVLLYQAIQVRPDKSCHLTQ